MAEVYRDNYWFVPGAESPFITSRSFSLSSLSSEWSIAEKMGCLGWYWNVHVITRASKWKHKYVLIYLFQSRLQTFFFPVTFLDFLIVTHIRCCCCVVIIITSLQLTRSFLITEFHFCLFYQFTASVSLFLLESNYRMKIYSCRIYFTGFLHGIIKLLQFISQVNLIFEATAF